MHSLPLVWMTRWRKYLSQLSWSVSYVSSVEDLILCDVINCPCNVALLYSHEGSSKPLTLPKFLAETSPYYTVRGIRNAVGKVNEALPMTCIRVSSAPSLDFRTEP